MMVLQTSPLPLGYHTKKNVCLIYRRINGLSIDILITKFEVLPLSQNRNRAAFSFLGKDSAVFVNENPRILFMAKRQKLQECVSLLSALRTSNFVPCNLTNIRNLLLYIKHTSFLI